jgi:hypothetical protein
LNLNLFFMALLVGLCTWAFRYGPTRLNLKDMPEDGLLARFLAASGPAAIATLFVASALPVLRAGTEKALPLAAGTLGVLVVFYLRRSVVAATLAGAASYGCTVWLGL